MDRFAGAIGSSAVQNNQFANGSLFIENISDYKNKRPIDRLDSLQKLGNQSDQESLSVWRKAWMTSAGQAERQLLLLNVELLPNRDRVDAYRQILKTKDFVGAIPFDRLPDENGISYSNWSALSKLIGEDGIQSASEAKHSSNLRLSLIRLLSYIAPQEESGKGWLQIAKQNKKESEKYLVEELANLPYDVRLEPYWHAMHKFEPQYLADIVAASPPDERLNTLKSVLDMTPGDARSEILNRIEMPEERKERQEFLELSLAKCTDRELSHRNFVSELSPEINTFSRDYSNRSFGFTNLSGKLEQDFFWTHLNYDDFLRLGFAGESAEFRKFLDQEPASIRDVLFRYIRQDNSIGEVQSLTRKISKISGNKSASQLVLEAMKSEPPKSESDYNQSLRADVAVRAVRDLDRKQISSILNDMGTDLAQNMTPTDWNISFAASLAWRIAAEGKGEYGDEFKQIWSHFVKPLQDALDDPAVTYTRKLELSREIALCSRESKRYGVSLLDDLGLPSAKMPPRFEEFEKNGVVADQVRNDLESALFDNDKLNAMLGDGLLGKLFPDVFGWAEQGGMKGRKQHGGHDYTIDAHTFMVLHYVRENSEFKNLSSYDQRNILLAAFLHDVSKRQGEKDPDHERVSAGWADGVLTTLGYPPEQVGRISTLISRHGDLSFARPDDSQPDINNQAYIDDLSVFYSNPVAIRQLRILNEADIRAVKMDSQLWTPEVRKYLDNLSQQMAANVYKLNKYRLPILTSALPHKFGIIEPSSHYAYFAHSSTFIDKQFWDQISSIESSNCDLSASLVTSEFGSKLYREHDLVALLSAPYENLAAAYHGNLLTGHGIDWSGHVKLTHSWALDSRAKEIADQVAGKIGKDLLRYSMQTSTDTVGVLDKTRRDAAKYNSLDEVIAAEGSSSYLFRAEQEIQKAMTSKADGTELTEFDEVKINNPVVSGLGIFRRGRSVFFQGVSSKEQLRSILGTKQLPDWLQEDGVNASSNSVMIPMRVWMEAQKKHIPFVILDN